MREVELKFQIPPDRLPALRKALSTASAVRETLQATYYDTADRALARRSVALRIRREGRRWVQTAKAAGADAMTRLEHEVDLGLRRPAPGHLPDPTLHAAHPELHAALQSALDEAEAPLQALYQTRIERTRRVVRVAGARVELALDEGEIEAGTAALPVCELEFELLAGSPSALVGLARVWARRHHLWLDPRSKAERGDHLARGAPVVPATRVAAVRLKAQQTPLEALVLGLHGTLAAWLANAAQLADAGGDRSDCIHQLRVALRRTRVLLSVFGDVLPAPPSEASALEPPLEDAVADAFRELGRFRDQDVLNGLIGGPLHAGGYALPPLAVFETPGGLSASVRSVAFTDTALRVLQAIASAAEAAARAPSGDGDGAAAESPPPSVEAGQVGDRATDPKGPKPAKALSLRRWARQALAREWKRFAKDARHFAALEAEQQHRVRKRAKRLRYALDFSQGLFPQRKVERFLVALASAQDALGTYTDVLMGQEHLRRRPLDDAAAAFARGWLSARREVTLKACERPLKRLLKTPPPWD